MSYSSMILLQIGCEFLDACSGENNGVAAQVLTAGGGITPLSRPWSRCPRNKVWIRLCQSRSMLYTHLLSWRQIAATTIEFLSKLEINTDLVSVSRVRFFYRATLY